MGCNNTCTFCIVPSLRGKETDRRPGDILAEIRALVAEGVTEVTLLGQNVNAYGVEFGDRQAFSKLLRACGEIEGLERVRFTSPHPAEFTDDVIEAMAQTPNVMPQLHMPLQSGSDRVLKAMRRSYRQAKFLGIIDRVRAAMPHAAITTDIIVGFPGETEEDFQATLDVVRQARFANAFTFQYSIRPGTPAATMPDQIAPEVVKDRYQRLVALVEEIAWEENKKLVGSTVELMVSEGEGRKDRATAPALGPRPGQPAGPLRRRLLRGRGRLRASRRHGHRRGHLRRAAPPGRRRPGALGPAHPRGRRLGAAYVGAPRPVRRRAGHAEHRRPRAAAARARLRLAQAGVLLVRLLAVRAGVRLGVRGLAAHPRRVARLLAVCGLLGRRVLARPELVGGDVAEPVGGPLPGAGVADPLAAHPDPALEVVWAGAVGVGALQGLGDVGVDAGLPVLGSGSCLRSSLMPAARPRCRPRRRPCRRPVPAPCPRRAR